jgi:2-amino-4-hydroxy-6-hydroxymethyldihydropteridine diphosphokinase
VPHPRMHSRAFVLAPLSEIAPDIEIPGQGAIGPLLAACAGQTVEKLEA